ncbi:GAF domain-containing SpoIIE family protein phosphatase [Aquiflexum gelatinilyticum]|uniref:SpoIIE family protein phosphatase n=1 Tax=Aquiflexum gelatinilyticum TaxID=2961943 RepID=A0A9X2SXU7_9BACT|nr:GAF domain-containing SpoIIE family protein phosphatase [Aquiflexum gelatinilyticum]MCR9014194.1 SpoIIE family protein phosphatase [Aquiflexum gelatinilyticum]MCS4433673.1 SpoIIE family protein phosphatase [Aquiflexum gelatinilyticum]
MLKIPTPNIGKISILVAILTWLALLFVDITRIFQSVNQMDHSLAPEISYVLEILFFILVYIFYNHSINKNENIDFLNLIWRGVSTGLLATIISLSISIFYMMLGGSKLGSDPLLSNFFYHVNFAFVSLFLISCSLLWKHLILYQKTKKVVQQWQAFEVLLLMCMFFVFFNGNNFDYSFIFGLVFLTIFSASLSINLKWIPYLTFKEKWKSILFLVIILICTIYLFSKFGFYSESEIAFVNLNINLFLMGLFAFVAIYTLFSFLVTLFNLPTSSVFEQKLVEAINFQRLSQSIKPGQDENQVLDILIDSSMSASYADGGWLEILDKDQIPQLIQKRFIDEEVRQEIITLFQTVKPFSEFDWTQDDNDTKKFYGKIPHNIFKSAFLIPLVVNKKTIGRMYLVKEVRDGFNKEMINIITTFVGQASISVENYRLLNEAIKTERYKEELKIAQRVQRSLLPKELHHNEKFEICGFSVAADEVGGDYYETKNLDEGVFSIIIGDVSGKGTSAAFNMSQMKGIFHSLVQLKPSPGEFLFKANTALSQCLERNHFITTSYFLLDTNRQTIKYSRAGHCPTLFYDHSEDKASYLSAEGLGLGIVRSPNYRKYIHESEFHYDKEDILVLYTDGIIEAKNKKGVEFGYDNLKAALMQHKNLSAELIQKRIIDQVYQFVGEGGIPDDDFSIMVIKFNS